jgi:hypothetical protein
MSNDAQIDSMSAARTSTTRPDRRTPRGDEPERLAFELRRGGPGAKDAPHTFSDEDRAQGQDPFGGLGELERRAALAWVGENLTLVRRSAFGQRILYWSLGIGFMVGLAAYVGGYLIKSSTTTGSLLGLVGDLLYTFGWALWTGVVVVVFLQIIPEAKRRGYKAWLDAYEAALREEAGARSDEASPD